MRIKSLVIIVITLFSCTTQSVSIKNWFPIDSDFFVNHHDAIYEYMYNFKTDDVNVARNAYLDVLAFTKEVIDASYENWARAEKMEITTLKRHALVDGILIIIESTEMTRTVMKWSETQNEFVEAPAGSVFLLEFALIISYSMQYNYLLDHWYSLTSELLGEHIDVNALHDALKQKLQPFL